MSNAASKADERQAQSQGENIKGTDLSSADGERVNAFSFED